MPVPATILLETAMREALRLAQLAFDSGEVPVGAVVLDSEGRFIGQGANRREVDADPTAHAEILALREAAKAHGSWRLDGCTLVVTLEPCVMCAGAIVNSRIGTLVYGCRDAKGGAARSLYAVPEDPRLNHRAGIVEGVLEEECSALLVSFFDKLRRRRKSGVDD